MNIAMVIPTYNRPVTVDDTLGRGIDAYAKHGIDVYYYDGSTNDETQKVVQKYIDMGYDNIKYLSYQNQVGIGRVCSMYNGVGLEKKYDYIWPVKDRVWFEEPTIVEAKKAMEEEHDIIFLGVLECYTHPGIGTKVYDIPEEFYADWGYLATSIDVNIMKWDTVLAELSYEEITKLSDTYTHFDIVFRGLAKAGRSVKVLVGEEIVAYNSDTARSGYSAQVFLIWLHNWIEVNEKLPECYNSYKDMVIKQGGTLPWIFGSLASLLAYKENGAFDNADMKEVIDNWHRVSDIPKEKLLEIADKDYNPKHDIDIIPKNVDGLLDVYIELAQLVRDGKLDKKRIPIIDIVKGTFGKAMEKCRRYPGTANILLGSLEDITKYIIQDAKTTDEVNKALQILLVMTILSLPDTGR